MFQRLVVCFFLIFGVMASGQKAHAAITGKVTNKAGSPVASAILTLVGKGLKDTSGADGTFSFVTTGVTGAASVRPNITAIALNNGFLEFSLKDAAPVKVEIFDVNGNLLKKESRQTFSAGFYRLNVSEISRTSNLLVIHASIGQNTKTFRYVPLRNGSSMVNSTVDRSSAANGTMATIMADITDTIKVTATGFSPKAVPVTSYDAVMDITLDSAGAGAVTVQLGEEMQTFQGFGINACLMSGSIFNIDECYGLEGTDRLGMSVIRIGMNSNGQHRDVPSGWEKARDTYKAKVIASCWSAPGSYKTNGQENDGGHLKPQYYKQWADTIASYAKKYKVDVMGIANEADFSSACAGKPPCTDHYASMTYTGKEMVAFVKEARKSFNSICPNTKMMAPEASLWIHVWSNISPTGIGMPGAPNGGYNSSDPHGCGCFSNDITPEAAAKCAAKCNEGEGYDYGHWLAKDTAAWNAIDILGVHEYESQKAYAWPADVTGGKRTKEIYQTEMSGVMYWPEAGPTAHIENGVAVARWIQSALMVGEASVWCYWWYGAPYYTSDDNEGLALIKGSNQKTKRYYTYGNYSKYIRPGHKIVNITGTAKLPAKVLLTASKDDAGKVVIVAVNETTTAQSVPITIAGGTVPASFKPIVTNKDANWSEKTVVTVTGGVLTAQLEPMSVTTFVSQ